MSSINKPKLGRGLEGLLPKDYDKAILNRDERIQKLFIKDVIPNPDQPRKQFDDDAIQELGESIKQYGLLQPIIVSPLKQGGYQIIAGERRWRAAQRSGLKDISAIVREKDQLEQLEIALIENVQRVDLSPLEQAVSIEYLHEQFNLSYQDIARKLGKAATTVNNIVRLLGLPSDAREALRAGRITEGHARSILALKSDPELQARLLVLIINESWSVRQSEQFVTAHKEGLKSRQAVTQRTVRETPETKKLAKKIGSKVTIRRTAKGGRLEIHFKDDQDLQNICKKLA